MLLFIIFIIIIYIYYLYNYLYIFIYLYYIYYIFIIHTIFIVYIYIFILIFYLIFFKRVELVFHKKETGTCPFPAQAWASTNCPNGTIRAGAFNGDEEEIAVPISAQPRHFQGIIPEKWLVFLPLLLRCRWSRRVENYSPCCCCCHYYYLPVIPLTFLPGGRQLLSCSQGHPTRKY